MVNKTVEHDEPPQACDIILDTAIMLYSLYGYDYSFQPRTLHLPKAYDEPGMRGQYKIWPPRYYLSTSDRMHFCPIISISLTLCCGTLAVARISTLNVFMGL